MGTRDCKHTSAMASPSVGEAGKTGQWRTQRPVVDQAKCTVAKTGASCYQCWLYCPEAVIERRSPIEVNLDYCKGCGICAAECPAGAITMQSESGADASSGESGEEIAENGHIPSEEGGACGP